MLERIDGDVVGHQVLGSDRQVFRGIEGAEILDRNVGDRAVARME
jgi:hypothetical protein